MGFLKGTGYAWFYTDGVQDWRVYDSFNQIRKMDQNGHYCLELDDEANNSYFHVGENDDYMPCPVIFTVWDNKVTEINVGSNSLYYKTDFNIENYINSHYLEGTYKDSNDVTFKFTPEMKAIWGDRTFEYVLFDWEHEESFGEWGGYFPMCVVDSSKKPLTTDYYAYQRVDNKLYIYNADFWDIMIVFVVEEKPYLVLDKVD